jgi:hypothetical protein
VLRLLFIPTGALAAALLAAAPPARAAEETGAGPAKKPAPRTTVAAPAAPRATVKVVSIPLQECPADDNESLNAVKAFIDPATGELRAPTPEDEAALARALAPAAVRRAQAARQVQALPNGILAVEVGDDLMMDAVVRTAPDGTLVYSCTPRPETPRALTREIAPKNAGAPAEK